MLRRDRCTCVSEANYAVERCVRSRTYGYYTGCCSGSHYDTRRYVCCDGYLRTKRSGYFCCGKYTYSSSSYICCNGVAQYKSYGSYTGCCGYGKYRFDRSDILLLFEVGKRGAGERRERGKATKRPRMKVGVKRTPSLEEWSPQSLTTCPCIFVQGSEFLD